MSTTKTRRGRPKGTGIDDREPLIQIAALMAGNPDLKPTTAIRRLGITEPSVIRRLRDKFKVFCAEQIAHSDGRSARPSLSPTGPLAGEHLTHDRNGSAQSAEIASFSVNVTKEQPSASKAHRYSSQKSAIEIRA